jgi:hypothetical protein
MEWTGLALPGSHREAVGGNSGRSLLRSRQWFLIAFSFPKGPVPL